MITPLRIAVGATLIAAATFCAQLISAMPAQAWTEAQCRAECARLYSGEQLTRCYSINNCSQYGSSKKKSKQSSR